MLYRKYTIEFTCNFRLKRYPFDTQRCSMAYVLKSLHRDEAVLRMNTISYRGEKELLEYRIKEISPTSDTTCGERITNHRCYLAQCFEHWLRLKLLGLSLKRSSCNHISVTFKRRVGNQLLNTYLPTSCLLIIIYLTHYFKIEHYDIRIMVGLTGTKNNPPSEENSAGLPNNH